MKFVFTIAAIASCLQGAAAIDSVAPENAMAQLSSIMGDSKRNLARAQKRQEKVMKKLHKQLAQEFVAEAQKLGASIGDYARELAEARSELSQAMDLAKDVLAHSNTTTSDWRSPIISEKAKVNAQLGSAEHDLHHAERRDKRSVREATEKVEEAMEENAEKLSMKVGDLSEETTQAKQALSSAADQDQATNSSATAKSSKNALTLKTIPQMLEVAMKKAKDDATKASGKFDAILSQAQKDADALEKKTEKQLKEAEEKVISKVLGIAPDRSHTQPKHMRGSKTHAPPPVVRGWNKKAPINLHPKAAAPRVNPRQAVHINHAGQKYQTKKR